MKVWEEKEGGGRKIIEERATFLRLKYFKLLICQLVLFKMLQLQGASPMTLIEVKSHQLVISKMLQLHGASPLTPIEVTSHMFYAEIAYLMSCYFENAPAFQNSSAYNILLKMLQGATPITLIEVKFQQLISKNAFFMLTLMLRQIDVILKLETFHIFYAEMFEIAYLTTCYLKNVSASGDKQFQHKTCGM